MKKLTSILLTISIIFSSFTLFAFAREKVKPYDDSQYFTYGDYDIHYRVIPAKGEQKGRIMMLHGFLCSTYHWRNMAKNLTEQGYECVLADVPNFGYSTREKPEMEIVDREVLITKLMESIAPMNEWILAGHSMGGGLSVNIAIENPVKALLLFCPSAQNEAPAGIKKAFATAPIKNFFNGFFKNIGRAPFLVKLMIYVTTDDWKFSMNYDIKGYTNAFEYDNFGSGISEMLRNVRLTDLANVNKIECPILLVQAENDNILNGGLQAQMNDAFSHATYYEVKGKGSGHNCIENRADELTQVTLDFLNK